MTDFIFFFVFSAVVVSLTLSFRVKGWLKLFSLYRSVVVNMAEVSLPAKYDQ